MTSNEQRRSLRRTIVIALLLLAALHTLKACYPRHTVASIYSAYFSSSRAPADTVDVSSPEAKQLQQDDGSVQSTTGIWATNGSLSNNVAVLIDPQFRPTLVPLLVHYKIILGPAWPILIYTTRESASRYSTSISLARHFNEGSMQLRHLPQDVLLANPRALHAFLTDAWIWESLAPAQHVLLFQSDSTLCGNSARTLEDYLRWDFLGASMAADYAREEIGLSLSLRKRETMLKVLEEETWSAESKMNEDEWFLAKLRKYKEQEDAEAGDENAINLPDKDVSHTFSIQRAAEYAAPLAVHQVHRWTKEDLMKLDKWCPEWKLCSADFGWSQFRT